MTSVDSQVVFITGGGHGIGAEVARRLHAKGAKLVLTDLDAAALKAIAGELGGEERVLTVIADVRDLPAMESAAEQAVQSRSRTGKPARMLKSKLTEAWEQPGAPKFALVMPDTCNWSYRWSGESNANVPDKRFLPVASRPALS